MELNVHHFIHPVPPDSRLEAKLDQILTALGGIHKQEIHQMEAIDTAIQSLTDQMTANTTVVGSVKVFLTAVPQLIKDAVAQAVAKGATPAEVQAITDLGVALQKNSQDLADALVAGTPAAA